MMSEAEYDLHRLEILGYEVLARSHPQNPGFSGLRMVLPRQASGHELETLTLTVVDWQGRPQLHRIHSDTTANQGDRVALGRIYVRSHKEAEGTFFTFGGQLAIDRLAQETILTVSSQAPLFELSPERETVSNLLVAESEALLGRVEAAQQWSHDIFIEKLTAAGPLAVYRAILQSLLEEYEPGDPLGRLRQELRSLLDSERKWYKQANQWPLFQPDLATLIGGQ
jgi:hypothetical protein